MVGVVRVRGQCENTPLREQSGAFGTRPCDAAIFAPRDIRDAIVPREPFIEECVVRGPEVQRTSVLTQLAFDEQFSFASESAAQLVVEFGEELVTKAVDLGSASIRRACDRRARASCKLSLAAASLSG